jgi:hypothetical protein
MDNYFFHIFILTLAFTRALLFVYPIPAPTIGRIRTHHYMYGIIAILVGLMIHSILVYSIGFGLFVDELTYLFIRGKTHEDNYSRNSLLGTLFFAIVVFVLKDYLMWPFAS